MTDQQLLDNELHLRLLAHNCPLYAPGKKVDPSVALYNATRSGATSAACGERYMEALNALKKRGLKPVKLNKETLHETI